MKKTLAISLAFGDIYSNAGTGQLNLPLDGSIARFEKVTLDLPYDIHTLVVCTAGYTRKEPLVPQPERLISLAHQLEHYVQEHVDCWHERLLAQPLCWSTRNEVRVGIKLAQRFGFAVKEERVDVVVASNLSHLFRIWMYAHLYKPRTWKLKLRWAHHNFSLLDHLMEPAKMTRDIVYIARVLIRLRKLKNKTRPTVSR